MPRWPIVGLILAGAVAAGNSLLADAPPAVSPQSEAKWSSPPSFVEDVIPVFTRLGCNQGACHGKNEGRNGFRLSLRGYAPELDIERLTRESRGRRVHVALPEDSLILRKPTGQTPHGGGALIAVGSPEYQLLLDWIRAGAPGPLDKEAHVAKIALTSGDLTLHIGEQRPLTVQATYTDGRTRDVTWLTQFASNDVGVTEVSPAGVVRALRNGETAVRAHFRGLVATAVVSVPFERPIDAGRLAQRNNFIDQCVFDKLARLRIPSADLCSDATFVRRAFLDAIGTLPTPAGVKAFLADAAPDKRAKLIDSLLARPEYVDYWTLQLADLLQNRRERDHDCRGEKGVRAMHEWLRQQVAANRPWNELVRDVLTVSGSSSDRPEIGYYIVNIGENHEADRSDIAPAVAQAFLGTRIGCAKCHNHPLEKYTQDDYYHFAAYFCAVKLDRGDMEKKTPTKLSFAALEKGKQFGSSQPRTGQFLALQAFDGTKCDAGPNDDPRGKLAAWVTDPKNEYFSGAMVNRLWSHFFGAGLVEPVDDLRASNPPSNPELWRALNREFVEHGFDLKHMMRLMLNSRTYQLSSATEPGNEADRRFYSHYLARRLEAEVLLDAACQATDAPERFEGYPVGVRAIQLCDPLVNSYFLTQFGRSERVTPCACERRNEVTITQLLELENSDVLRDKVLAGNGRLDQWLKSQPDNGKLMDELFLTALARSPTAAETELIKKSLAEGGSRNEVFQDLFWALLNSKEFVFNH